MEIEKEGNTKIRKLKDIKADLDNDGKHFDRIELLKEAILSQKVRLRYCKEFQPKYIRNMDKDERHEEFNIYKEIEKKYLEEIEYNNYDGTSKVGMILGEL